MFESEEILSKIAQSAYDPTPPKQIGPYKLISHTATLKFYDYGDKVIIGIRGTKPSDKRDLHADAAVPMGQLVNTQRYKNDEHIIRQYRMRYPRNHFYAATHSLGSAIADLLLHKGLIRAVVSFNGAIEPHYVRHANANHRIYNEDDPLYAIMGRFSINPTVRKNAPQKWWERLLSKFSYTQHAIEIYRRLQAHKVENITETNA